MVRMVPEQLSSFVWEFPSGSNVQRLRKPCQRPVPEAHFGNQQQLSPDLCSLRSNPIHFINFNPFHPCSFSEMGIFQGPHIRSAYPCLSLQFQAVSSRMLADTCGLVVGLAGCTGRSHASSYALTSRDLMLKWCGWMVLIWLYDVGRCWTATKWMVALYCSAATC